jgi:hypothetical protein
MRRCGFEEAAWRIGLQGTLVRRWVREAAVDPIRAFPGRGHGQRRLTDDCDSAREGGQRNTAPPRMTPRGSAIRTRMLH